MFALRCKACSSSSNSNIAAPSPITNPSRFLSKGREAWLGVSLKAVLKARILQNPAIDNGSMHDSPLPANIISASPFRIKRIASPMACEPVAQAVDTEWLGPRKPCRILMWPHGILGIMESGVRHAILGDIV
uniref:Uncharacterized protein n=1 Tax=Glossina pallidipes TaxID=7398 RepID=A0A1B0A9R9_GLOPL